VPLSFDQQPSRDELLALYDAVGWTTYTAEPDRLVQAVANSTWVVTYRDDDDTLVGLARVVSDLTSIAYIQDLLVAPTHQRSGIGGALLDGVLERCHGIRQVVLVTDAEAGQRAFYESRGLQEVHDVRPAPLRSFVRLL